MRDDATFIGVEVDDSIVGDADLAQKLQDACPVDIFSGASGKVEIVHDNLDECILCGLCLDATPAGTVKVHKLYSDEVLASS
jgi:NAD-dependent dihydropyrimidine dehydrogenase PreA subunit